LGYFGGKVNNYSWKYILEGNNLFKVILINFSMGEEIKFNWILKLKKKDLDNLKLGETRDFSKYGHRIYPLKSLIDLVDEEFNTYGAIKIKNYSLGENRIGDKVTKGEYKILHLCTPEEKEVLSKYNQGKYGKI
jgi:hypothetical protein